MMPNLKEVPTDQLLAELLDRERTDEECIPLKCFVRRLARYELVLIEESERNIREGKPCSGHVENTIIALAKLFLAL